MAESDARSVGQPQCNLAFNCVAGWSGFFSFFLFSVLVKTELSPKRYCRGQRSQDAVKEEGDYT